MKFIRLEILNLASLDRADGERIDFEEGALGKSNIFSIVGPTGSGKSTLLDAICLALYGRAPRYPRVKGEIGSRITIYGAAGNEEKNRPAPTDCCNILTRGKKNGYSKLTFKANDGSVYRAEWSVTFKQKKYDGPYKSLYKLLSNGDVEEHDWNIIPQIIGLDYNQFLRTVLIAQGTFANFLSSSEEDRYMLLEKLVDSDNFYSKIAERIKQKYKDAHAEYGEICIEHSKYDADILKEPELTTTTEKIKQLDEEDKAAKKELTEVTKAIDWYIDEEKYLDRIKEQSENYNTAQQNLTYCKPIIDRLAIHDTTVEAVKYYQDYIGNRGKVKEIEEQLKGLGEKIATKKADIANGEKELLPLQQDAQRTSAELENQKPHIKKAREIKAELATLKKTLGEKKTANEKAAEALDKANKAVKDNSDRIATLEKEKAAADKALESLKEKIKAGKEEKEKAAKEAADLFDAKVDEIKNLDAAALQDADKKANEKKTDLTAAIRIRKDIAEKSGTLEKDNTEIKKLEARNDEIAKELSTLQIEGLRDELDTLKKSHTLMTSKDWQLHRAGLADGKPCPLCGAEHHPYESDSTFVPAVSKLGELIEAKSSALVKMEENEKSLNGEKDQNIGKIDGLKTAIDNLESELKKLHADWTTIHEKYPTWPENPRLLEQLQPQVNNEAEQAKNALDEYNKKSAEKEKLRLDKEKAEQELQKYDKESNLKIGEAQKRAVDAVNDLSAEQAKTQNLVEQQKEKDSASEYADKAFKSAQSDVDEKEKLLKAELGDKDPDKFEAQLEKAKEDAAEAVKKKNDAIDRLKNELSGLEGQVKPTTQQKEEEQRKESINKGLLDSWLAVYNGSHDPELHLSVDNIKEISGYADDWPVIRRKKEELQNAVTSTQTTLDNTRKDHDTHQASKPEKDKATLEARKAELEQRSDAELVNLKARMQRHEAARAALGPLAEQMQAAETKKKAWDEINEAIGSDGKILRKIAQCYTLGFLIEHANAEIRKFNSRYELKHVKNSLGIRVIDHDRADDVRDTTSLSGGETFIVSLGLALGLSSLSSRNISFENLFIDEGFGTLDPETLTTVITSLAMLQSSQGKKVGVISHTDTMSELITTQIRVIKNGNPGSSRIEIIPQ